MFFYVYSEQEKKNKLVSFLSALFLEFYNHSFIMVMPSIEIKINCEGLKHQYFCSRKLFYPTLMQNRVSFKKHTPWYEFPNFLSLWIFLPPLTAKTKVSSYPVRYLVWTNNSLFPFSGTKILNMCVNKFQIISSRIQRKN